MKMRVGLTCLGFNTLKVEVSIRLTCQWVITCGHRRETHVTMVSVIAIVTYLSFFHDTTYCNTLVLESAS